MDILDLMGVSKLSAKVFFLKVNSSIKITNINFKLSYGYFNKHNVPLTLTSYITGTAVEFSNRRLFPKTGLKSSGVKCSLHNLKCLTTFSGKWTSRWIASSHSFTRSTSFSGKVKKVSRSFPNIEEALARFLIGFSRFVHPGNEHLLTIV